MSNQNVIAHLLRDQMRLRKIADSLKTYKITLRNDSFCHYEEGFARRGNPKNGLPQSLRFLAMTISFAKQTVNDLTSYRLNVLSSSKKVAFTLAETLITLGIIGVVAAMTMPSLIAKHQKHVTVNRLKTAYSQLYQAVNLSVSDNGEIGEWDFENSTAEEVFEKYLLPYLKIVTKDDKRPVFGGWFTGTKRYILSNGSTIYCNMYHYTLVNRYLSLNIDINGDKSPNILGKDRFIFYVFPKAANIYNTGTGDAGHNVPKPGLYPDGYGMDRDFLKFSVYRGCNMRDSEEAEDGNNAGAYCTALIMLDGWKISDDYDW